MAFNPNEARDAHGKWIKGVGDAKKALEAILAGHAGSSNSPISKGDARLAAKGLDRHVGKGRKLLHSGTGYEHSLANLDHIAKKTREDAVKLNATNPKLAQQLRKQARALEAIHKAHSGGAKDVHVPGTKSKDTPTKAQAPLKPGEENVSSYSFYQGGTVGINKKPTDWTWTATQGGGISVHDASGNVVAEGKDVAAARKALHTHLGGGKPLGGGKQSNARFNFAAVKHSENTSETKFPEVGFTAADLPSVTAEHVGAKGQISYKRSDGVFVVKKSDRYFTHVAFHKAKDGTVYTTSHHSLGAAAKSKLGAHLGGEKMGFVRVTGDPIQINTHDRDVLAQVAKAGEAGHTVQGHEAYGHGGKFPEGIPRPTAAKLKDLGYIKGNIDQTASYKVPGDYKSIQWNPPNVKITPKGEEFLKTGGDVPDPTPLPFPAADEIPTDIKGVLARDGSYVAAGDKVLAQLDGKWKEVGVKSVSARLHIGQPKGVVELSDGSKYWSSAVRKVYVPQGKGDHESHDYTDDPKQLIKKFSVEKLNASLKGAGDPQLKFDYEETVPRAAVEEAVLRGGGKLPKTNLPDLPQIQGGEAPKVTVPNAARQATSKVLGSGYMGGKWPAKYWDRAVEHWKKGHQGAEPDLNSVDGVVAMLKNWKAKPGIDAAFAHWNEPKLREELTNVGLGKPAPPEAANVRRVTKVKNADGTFSYAIDGKVTEKNSKVDYKYASHHLLDGSNGGVPSQDHVTMYHRTAETANKAKYKYGSRIAVKPIEEVPAHPVNGIDAPDPSPPPLPEPPSGVDEAKLDKEITDAMKESLHPNSPRFTVHAVGGVFEVHDITAPESKRVIATFDDRGKARRNARARNRKLGIGPKTKSGGGGTKKNLQKGSWVTNKDGRRGEIIGINPKKELQLPKPEDLIDAEAVLGKAKNPYVNSSAIIKEGYEKGFLAGVRDVPHPLDAGYYGRHGYKEGVKARKAELKSIKNEQAAQKAEARGGYIVRYNTGKTEVLQAKNLRQAEAPVSVYRHKGEPPAQAGKLYDALKLGVEADETDWTLLDPAKRTDIPQAAVVGHAQELLYDLARGNERPEAANVISNAELKNKLTEEGWIAKQHEAVSKKVPYKISVSYATRAAYSEDPAMKAKGQGVYSKGEITVPADASPEDKLAARALYTLEVNGGGVASPKKGETYYANSVRENRLPGETLLDTIKRLGLQPPVVQGSQFDEMRNRQINKLVETRVNKEIKKRREKEGSTSIAYNLPHWNGVRMVEQNWKSVVDHVNLASRGSFVPVFHTHGRVEDAVVYHRKDGVTSARVLTGEADKLTQAAMLKAGAKSMENSKNIDPGYRGRGKIYPGTMLKIELEKGRSVTAAEGHAEMTTVLAERPEKDPGNKPNVFARGEFIQALRGIVGSKKTMTEGQWNDAIKEAHTRALQVSQDKATKQGAKFLDYEKNELATGTVKEMLQSVERAYGRQTGGKSIEYVPHEQPKLGAPTSQRGRFTTHGLSPEEATKKMQELGLVGEVESHVPFEAAMRSGRRDGLVLPLHRDYLTGDAPPPTLLHLITHGVTSHDPKVVESILRGGGVHSIAERYRRGIRVNSSSPSGDIRSGIDHVVFGAHDSGSTCGGGSPVKIAYKPEALLRRNVVMAPRDYGGMDTRYDMYKNYLNSLQRRAGEPTGSLYQPVSPKVRQAHIAARTRPGSAEFNIAGSIPVEDMAVIGVQNQADADRINKILEEELAAGRITSRPDVVIGREAFRVRVEA